jgi:gluconolactonase
MSIFEVYHPGFHSLVDIDAQPEIIKDDFQFTEGPVWHARDHCLYFSDIPADTLYRYTEQKGVEVVYHPSGFSNGLTLDRSGAILACEHRTRAVTRYTADKKQILTSTYQGKKLNSPNDIVISDQGFIYFTDPIYGLRAGNGGPAEAELSFQGLFCFHEGWAEPKLVCGDFERPNGVALSRDQKTLYGIDSVKQHIRIFNVREDGGLEGGQVFLELWGKGDARPDGMKLDEYGNLFSTGPEGIWVFNPEGILFGKIKFPLKTANLAFGGEDRRSLFITCSSYLLRLRLKTRGISPLDNHW